RDARTKPALVELLDDHPFERAPPPEPDQHPLRRRLLKRPRELVAKALAAEHVEVRQAELQRAARERLDAGAEPLEESRRPEDPGRIVDEAQAVRGPEPDAPRQVGAAVKRVEEPPEGRPGGVY